MLKVYHNPRCRKSREGLQYLSERGIDFEMIDYLKKSLTVEDLKEILKKLHKKPGEIIRKQELLYKKELKDRNFTDEEWIKIIIENPKLLQRPVVVGKYRAVIAQPPELALQVLPSVE